MVVVVVSVCVCVCVCVCVLCDLLAVPSAQVGLLFVEGVTLCTLLSSLLWRSQLPIIVLFHSQNQ